MRLSKSFFRLFSTATVLIFSSAIAHQQDPAVPVDVDVNPDMRSDTELLPGDQFDPKALPGDQYEPNALPGDQYEPRALPGDQYEPNALPGDQFDPRALPGDQYEPNALPGDQYEPRALPGDQYEPNALPGDQFDPRALPGDQFDSNAIPGDQFDPGGQTIPGSPTGPSPTTTTTESDEPHDCSPYKATEARGDLSSVWSIPNQKNHRQFTVPNDPAGGYVMVTLTADHPSLTPSMSIGVAPRMGRVIQTSGGAKDSRTITDVFEVAGGVTYDVAVNPSKNAPTNDYPVSYSLNWKFVGRVDCYEPNDAEQKRWATVLPVAKAIPLNRVIEASSIVGLDETGISGARLFDWYKFTLDEPRTVTIRTLQVPENVQAGLRLFSEEGRFVMGAPKPALGATTLSAPKLLPAGSYYLEWIPAKRGNASARTSEGQKIPNHFVQTYRISVTDGECSGAEYCNGGALSSISGAPSTVTAISEQRSGCTFPDVCATDAIETEGVLSEVESDEPKQPDVIVTDGVMASSVATLESAHNKNSPPVITYDSEEAAIAAAKLRACQAELDHQEAQRRGAEEMAAFVGRDALSVMSSNSQTEGESDEQAQDTDSTNEQVPGPSIPLSQSDIDVSAPSSAPEITYASEEEATAAAKLRACMAELDVDHQAAMREFLNSLPGF